MRTRMEKRPRLELPPQVPPAPLKIITEEFMDTPNSSGTSSPAESCASDAVKPLKPWERTTSIDSSVDSSEASDPLTEDDEDDEDHEDREGSIVIASCAKATAQSLRMQTVVRTMQQRLQGLQRLVQEAATQEKPRPQMQARDNAEGGENNSRTFPVEKTVVDGEEPAHERVGKPLHLASASPDRRLLSPLQVDKATDKLEKESAGEIKVSPGMITLLNRVKTLEAQLKEAADENQQLQNTVRRLEDENARLQDQTAYNPPEGIKGEFTGGSGSTESGHDQDSNIDEAGVGGISRLTTAIFGDPSAFQMAMEEDLAVLKNHERCQHKLHELWESIRTLRTFVETYGLERDAMRIERDDAIAEAERVDAENVKLACSSNPQRKIKYLEQVKKDNQALRRKNRALNVKIAKQAAKFIREKNGCSVLEDEDEEAYQDTLDPATLDGTLLQESDERSGEEVLHSMRDRRGVLEQQIERLRLARQSIPDDGSDSDSSGESELPPPEIPLAATSIR